MVAKAVSYQIDVKQRAVWKSGRNQERFGIAGKRSWFFRSQLPGQTGRVSFYHHAKSEEKTVVKVRPVQLVRIETFLASSSRDSLGRV